MKKYLKTLFCASVIAASSGVIAQPAQPKPETLVKWRQSAFQVIAWNASRVKANVEGQYQKDEVVKAANTIAALANSGIGSLFAPGTEQSKGWHDTSTKPELFKDGKRAGELFASFNKEANELARIAPTADAAAVKDQFGKLSKTCKACHDDFKNKD